MLPHPARLEAVRHSWACIAAYLQCFAGPCAWLLHGVAPSTPLLRLLCLRMECRLLCTR
jgi:hypothetical protein